MKVDFLYQFVSFLFVKKMASLRRTNENAHIKHVTYNEPHDRKMADGDDREENEHNQRDDVPNVPQIGNLQVGEPEESSNLEEGSGSITFGQICVLFEYFGHDYLLANLLGLMDLSQVSISVSKLKFRSFLIYSKLFGRWFLCLLLFFAV